MRAFAAWIIAGSVFSFGLAAAAQTPLIGEADTALPGGVYATMNADSVVACAQLCAADGLCLAWTYRAAANGACELKAVLPRPVAEAGAISGASSRAPAFAQALAATPAASAPAQIADNSGASAPHPASSKPDIQSDVESQLLGGPEISTAIALRSRLPEESEPR